MILPTSTAFTNHLMCPSWNGYSTICASCTAILDAPLVQCMLWLTAVLCYFNAVLRVPENCHLPWDNVLWVESKNVKMWEGIFFEQFSTAASSPCADQFGGTVSHEERAVNGTSIQKLCCSQEVPGNQLKITFLVQTGELLCPACTGTGADVAEAQGWSLPSPHLFQLLTSRQQIFEHPPALCPSSKSYSWQCNRRKAFLERGYFFTWDTFSWSRIM